MKNECHTQSIPHVGEVRRKTWFCCYFEVNGQNHIHFRLIQVLKEQHSMTFSHFQITFQVPCEQRLHFRGMSWRAKVFKTLQIFRDFQVNRVAMFCCFVLACFASAFSFRIRGIYCTILFESFPEILRTQFFSVERRFFEFFQATFKDGNSNPRLEIFACALFGVALSIIQNRSHHAQCQQFVPFTSFWSHSYPAYL